MAFYVVSGFLTPSECDKHKIFMNGHLNHTMTDLCNGKYSRSKLKEFDLAKIMTDRLREKAEDDELLRAWLGDRWSHCYVGSFFFWTAYGRGGYIGEHTDGTFSNADGKSVATMLIYVNQDYTGGRTIFTGPPVQAIQPLTGQALLLRQDALHHAEPVKAGKKLLLRVDVMLPT